MAGNMVRITHLCQERIPHFFVPAQLAQSAALMRCKGMVRRKKNTGFSEMAIAFTPEAPRQNSKRQKKNSDADAFNRLFGERLCAAREAMGMKQPDLAAALRVSVDRVKKNEIGETAFPIYLLPTLSKVVHRSLEWLITGRD